MPRRGQGQTNPRGQHIPLGRAARRKRLALANRARCRLHLVAIGRRVWVWSQPAWAAALVLLPFDKEPDRAVQRDGRVAQGLQVGSVTEFSRHLSLLLLMKHRDWLLALIFL